MGRNFTGERLESHIYNENSIKHLHRYAMVTEFIRNKITLDIACGEGYGSNIMSQFSSFVYGVDIDSGTIEHAQTKYQSENLKFVEGSTSKIPLDDDSVDVVVSFETLEHHDQHEVMFEEIKRVLRPNGVLFISTPDKHYYSDIRKYNNPFHVKELYKADFIKLVNNYFANSQILSQSYLNGNSQLFDDTTRETINYYTGNFLKLTLTTSHPEFLIAIASDGHFIKQNNSIFDGSDVFKEKTDDAIKKVYNSTTYKVGHKVLLPFKFVKEILIRLKSRK